MIAQPNHISIFAPMKLTDKATTPPSMANKNPGTDPEGKENILTSYSADIPEHPNWYIYEYESRRKVLVERDPETGKVQFLKEL